MVISGSPLLLGPFYKRQQYKMNYLDTNLFDNFIVGLNNTYDRINFYITRDNSISYKAEGRLQTEDEANSYDYQLKVLLKKFDEKYYDITNSADFQIGKIVSIIGDNYVNI